MHKNKFYLFFAFLKNNNIKEHKKGELFYFTTILDASF